MINIELVHEKLSVGQTFPSYRALCRYLGLPILSSDSLKAQKEELECYLKYKNVGNGNSIKITKIYQEPKQRTDKRSKGNNSKYIELIEQLLIRSLRKFNGHITISKTDLMLLLGMVNENYIVYRRKNINSNNLYDFSNHIRTIITNELNILNGKILTYKEVYFIVENGLERLANEEEFKLICDTEEQVIKDMGFTSKRQVQRSNMLMQMYSEINHV